MKIVVHFDALKALYDDDGSPVQDQSILSEWLASHIMPKWDRRRGERPPHLDFTIAQEADEETEAA